MPPNEPRKLTHGALQVVVLNDVVESVRDSQLLARDSQPLPDLPGALGRTFLKPPFELLDRRGDEDRHRARDALRDVQRPLGLELEHADLPLLADAVDLGKERAGALAPRKDVVLEEIAVLEAPVELLVTDEVVVDALDLAGAAGSRRRRDCKLELGKEGQKPLDQRAFAGTRLAGDDEDGQLVTG